MRPSDARGRPGRGPFGDLARPGRAAWSFPDLDVEPSEIPEKHRRRRPPGLPEVAERDLVRHYTRLSQMNYGVDTGIYPLGSCSMKYNPKLAEVAAAAPGFCGLHPLQPDRTAQGALEMLWRLEGALCEITGMARATLQPPAGASGELTGLLIMRAHHTELGDPRGTVLIPDSAHGTNPASTRLGGYRAVPVPSTSRGLVDVDKLAGLVNEDVAGLMLTNPNTLGLFEEDIARITAIVHDVGGLVYYDGANLNAIMGRSRPGTWVSTSSTSTPTRRSRRPTAGRTGAGPVGVVEPLVPYLPVPRIERDPDGTFRMSEDAPRSIGRVHGFHGNFGVLVRAYAYVFFHGSDGLQEVSELAVLNANYLASAHRGRLPARVPRFPPDARVRRHRGAPRTRRRRARDGCCEAG